ncbi:hypothetical protein [Bacillus marinisedimentorum]|uniref:hypothetical protein n=1 Tax=Bacillus marinisedimentorum TaxID=1821260 RepID=UPI001472358E|nr:hypothetical protein [Bacillus marinisedimentorum]
MEEFKALPILSKIGIIVFLGGAVSFSVSIILIFLSIKLANFNFPLYSIAVGLVGFLAAVIFDKGRRKRTKVGPLKGRQ